MIALGWFVVDIAALIDGAELVDRGAAPRPREATLVDHLGTILTVALTLYGLGMCLFLISENRRPQATLAWMLGFFFAPGVGALIYILFGRDWKAFSK